MPDKLAAVFRADGGPGHGAGHLMRCLALAEALSRRGMTPFLVTAQDVPPLLAAWRAREIGVEITGHSAAGSSDEEQTLETAQRLNAGVAIVDGYHFPPGYGRELRKAGVAVVKFDDSGRPAGSLEADIIVNPNPNGVDEDSRKAHARSRCGTATRMLQGARYALIREEVRAAGRIGGDGLLVTFGASDVSNIGLSVVGAFLACDSGTKVTLVCTAERDGYEAAESLARLHPSRLRVLSSTDIVPLMARADVAVCPGGMTALELCTLGVPFVTMPVAENQRPGVLAMAAAGATVTTGTPEEAARAAARILTEPEASRRLSTAARELVDGMGANRLAEAICRIVI